MVIDTSPAMSLLTCNALLYATEIIVPIGMDSLALVGRPQTLDGAKETRDLWPEHELRLACALPTMVNATTHATRAAFAALEGDDEMSGRLLESGTRQCIDLTYAAARHQTIWKYAPRSRGAEDYTAPVGFVYEGARSLEGPSDGTAQEDREA